MTEQELGFRPLISPESKFQPMKQIFNGFEIESKHVLLTIEEDYTKAKNGLITYNEVLSKGCLVHQGYIKDIQRAVAILQEMEIDLNEFKPSTIRFRQYGPGFKALSPYKNILTLKDRKETKRREVEFRLTQEQMDKYWPDTKGARVHKKRMLKTIKGFDFEFDAFVDRVLLLAECEVDDEAKLAKIPSLGMNVTNNSVWSNKNLAK